MELVLFLVFLSILSNAQSTTHVRRSRMTGGNEALSAQFPYQVGIKVGGEFHCGGSIIHERFVLSAAHCFYNEDILLKNNDVKVIAGVNDVHSNSPSKVEIPVEAIFIPIEYTKPANPSWFKNGDIAVLRLKHPLNLKNNRFIKKVMPPKAKSYSGEKAIVSGYGYNWVRVNKNPRTGNYERGPGGSNGKLRYSEAFIVTNAECGGNYGINTLPKSFICAKMIQKDSSKPGGICGGDSGGPLVVNGDVIIGVVSLSPTECKEHEQAAIYTRVSYWQNFIEDVVTDRTVKPNILGNNLFE